MPALGVSLAASGAVGVASDLTKAPSGRVRMLPVHPALAALFPWGGLRRGSTVGVRRSTALLLALLAAPTAADSWAAVVGLPDLGIVAAAELGVATDRLALVGRPGPAHAAVVAALLDGMDVVVTPRGRLSEAQARRLSARARHRGAVLLTPDPWPGVDVELRLVASRWAGVGAGHGHLTQRETTIRASGRGPAARPTHVTLRLPDVTGAPAGGPAPLPADRPAHPNEPAAPVRRVHPAFAPAEPARWQEHQAGAVAELSPSTAQAPGGGGEPDVPAGWGGGRVGAVAGLASRSAEVSAGGGEPDVPAGRDAGVVAGFSSSGEQAWGGGGAGWTEVGPVLASVEAGGSVGRLAGRGGAEAGGRVGEFGEGSVLASAGEGGVAAPRERVAAVAVGRRGDGVAAAARSGAGDAPVLLGANRWLAHVAWVNAAVSARSEQAAGVA